MTEQLNHTAAELRDIADLLDTLNKFEKKNTHLWLVGSQTIWMADMPMGKIIRESDIDGNLPDDLPEEWVYRPARGEDNQH